MESSSYARRLAYRVAVAYYNDGETQAEIAERFGISRIKVSRVLTRAREDGIVSITIKAPDTDHPGLERALEDQFGLKEAIVTTSGESYEQTIEQIGQAAAGLLERVVSEDDVVGLTWGNTVLAAARSLGVASVPGVQMVQLLGGLGSPDAEIHGAEVVREAAARIGGSARNIHAPGLVRSSEVREALIDDPQISGALGLAGKARIALLGIGALGKHSVLLGRHGVLTREDAKTLRERGVVGDVALRFYDSHGEQVDHPFQQRVIGIDVETLRSIPTRIGVAGGKEKRAAILGALRGGYVNVLITDHENAEAVLSDAHKQKNGLQKVGS